MLEWSELIDSAAPPRATRLLFDRYVLDLDRGCLLLDGHEVPLRPKTFAVLSYLVENAGRLVSKDDIFGAVWELGEDGSRLIRTIPRRGYRFDGVVTVPTVERPSPATAVLPQQALPTRPQSNESVRARVWAWARTVSAGRDRTASAILVAVALAMGALLISYFALDIPGMGLGRRVMVRPVLAYVSLLADLGRHTPAS
jgi:DNA-binding winged helix-turn-helix (wHTH) protein